MELVLNNCCGFEELSTEDFELVNGGSPETAAMVMIIGGAVITGVVSPIACVATGCNPAVFAVGVCVGTATMLTGCQIAAEAKKK